MEFIYIKRKYLIAYLLLFVLFSLSYSQTGNKSIKLNNKRFAVSVGMGVSYVNTPSFNDYLKYEIPYASKDSIKDFTAGFEAFAGLEYTVNKNFTLRFDYSYFIRSLTYYYIYYTYDEFYNIHQPFMMGYYVINGTHHQFKLGAGVGYLFSTLKETNSSATDAKYTANGLGYRTEIIFAADLYKNMESYLSGFINYYRLGALKNSSGNSLLNPANNEEVNLGGFGFGVRLGFSIKF